MSFNNRVIAKWLPSEIEEYAKICDDSSELENTCNNLLSRFDVLLNNLREKPFSNCNPLVDGYEIQISGIEDICTRIEAVAKEFDRVFKLLYVESVHELILKKLKMCQELLWRTKVKLTYFAIEMICEIASLFINYGEVFLVLTLRMSVSYNDLLAMDETYGLSNDVIVCNNTCPYLMFPMRRMSVTRLLQIIAYDRAELCCHKLIDCLLETYKFYDNYEEDSYSDNSSLEIYMTLTQHMSPPDESKNIVTKNKISYSITDSGSYSNLEELISYEEKNVVNFLRTTLRVAPALLGHDSTKKSAHTGKSSIDLHAREKVLEYYEQILWGEVGNYLEHVILWWAACPLASRSPHSSQHLREWIVQFIPTADIPLVISSTLATLADALGVHVISTSWDLNFRRALVASRTSTHPETGSLFATAIQDLVMLCNQCESTSDWMVGAPLEELPLVEQIHVLHRLDHTIYTTRLWAINGSKKFSNSWNVEAFFSVTHGDIVNCLNHLKNLKLADHTTEIEKGNLDVHVQVCSLMRAKLVSEIRANCQKLKDAPKDCIDGLASVCRIMALANLQLIFPPIPYWKSESSNEFPEKRSLFVDEYLDHILVPVLKAIDDPLITNMTLTLICEAWLDHIYMNKIKFSYLGACQLLTDFGYITTWLVECPNVDDFMRRKLIKNEILKRCEGVGRLLLRRPGERIQMTEKNKKRNADIFDEEKSKLMPAEMYVPNQEQWLELRVAKQKLFIPMLCCEEPKL